VAGAVSPRGGVRSTKRTRMAIDYHAIFGTVL
jgi:hypothetical protein